MNEAIEKTVTLKKAVAGVVGGTAIAAGSVTAAVPTEVTDAISTLQSDALTLIGAAGAGAVVVLAASMAWNLGLSIVPKFLKRGASKG
jgi:hypothetical protein